LKYTAVQGWRERFLLSSTEDLALAAARERMQELLRTINVFRARRYMNAAVFIDTNVLLYAIDKDPAAATKRARAQQILLSERWGWSLQVAAEFFVNATSAKRPFRLSPRSRPPG
jgi:hypothetical protein